MAAAARPTLSLAATTTCFLFAAAAAAEAARCARGAPVSLSFVRPPVPNAELLLPTSTTPKISQRRCGATLDVNSLLPPATPPQPKRNSRRARVGEWAGLLAASTGGDEIASPMPIVPESSAASTRAAAAAAVPAPHQPEETEGKTKVVGKPTPHLGAYWSILRPHNIPSSFGLVAAGALVSSHAVEALLDPKVLLTAFAAAAVSVGSCVLNDWFDIELDRVNDPERPLVTGEVVPVHALGIGVGFLLAAAASASVVHPAALQATIAASVALTSAYTPLLKPIPLMKNFVVAMVIAAAVAAGGLAAGAGVAATLTPTLLTFFVIAHREILMDITDIEGDREGGVRTLPVLVGRKAALAFAAALLTAGVVAAGVGILGGTTGSTTPVAMALHVLFTLPLYANLFLVARSSYAYEELSSAVEQSLGPLALMLGLMGVVLR